MTDLIKNQIMELFGNNNINYVFYINIIMIYIKTNNSSDFGKYGKYFAMYHADLNCYSFNGKKIF